MTYLLPSYPALSHGAYALLHKDTTLARIHKQIVAAHNLQDVLAHLLPTYDIAYGLLKGVDNGQRITSPQGTVLLGATLLHDILEDTPETSEAETKLALALRQDYGDEIANIVVALTRPPKMTRTQSNRHTYDAIRALGADATFVKLADRIQNVQRSWAGQDRRLFLYHREHAAFRSVCHNASHPGYVHHAWHVLEDLLHLGNV